MAPSSNGSRQLKPAARKITKPNTWKKARVKKPHKPLPKSRMILRKAIDGLLKVPAAVAGVTVIYTLGVVLLVRGLAPSENFLVIQALLDQAFTGVGGKLQSAVIQLTSLFGGSGNSQTANGGIYQTILLIVCSLAFIWVLRQSQAKHAVSTKQAFYKGMYPLIPFVLVVVIFGLQIVPFSLGAYLFNAFFAGSIAVHLWEKLLVIAAFTSLIYWSLRMITASVFALYIVTLPDTTPLQAIRSANQLVAGRRLEIWRKFLLLPIVIIFGTSLLLLPFILFLTPLVVWVFFLLSSVWFPLVHGYLYTLYRELLNHGK
ncbi:hypothetical protein KDA14_03795 [Candidatus Saccharibacteria bacterium]|nr:hypothetical protein [Candidatus Saccharibacteria bacterium]